MADLSGTHTVSATVLRRLKDTRPLLKAIGGAVVAESQRAFREKRLGEFTWPEQYPSQKDPFIHVAGAIGDLLRGAKVKERRFQRNPPLQDIGTLLRSVKDRISGPNQVTIGVNGPARAYAAKHQKGGTSRQTITGTARDALAKQMKTLRRARRKPKRQKKGLTAEEARENADRREKADKRLRSLEKLGFIFQASVVETDVNARPFLGITPRLEKRIRDLTRDFLQGKEVR